MRRNATHKRQGFTLIEVLMVIVILGMLAAVAVVSLRGTGEKSRIKTTKLTLNEVANTLDRYAQDMNGKYPTEEQGLQALLTKPEFENEADADKWAGPYLKKMPKDAWDHDLVYKVVEVDQTAEDAASQLPYKLSSNGKDGEPDTDDDIVYNKQEEEQGSGT